ncbi:hypothetical protein D1007_19715 [Hordeum vulgare]|nr:hypothetical protein D1007_19715 [Hordeum vulgare]
MHNGDETWLDNQPNNIAPNDFVDLPNSDENNYGSNGLGNTLRDEIAMQIYVSKGVSKVQSYESDWKKGFTGYELYNKLGDLYDGQIAEGNFNFTSIEATQMTDDDPEVERDETVFSFDLNQCEDDLHMYDDPRVAAQSDGPRGSTQSDGPIDGTQSDVTRAGAPGGSSKKPVEEPKRKKRDDPMVEVMANYVEIKRKQAQDESAQFAGSKMSNSSPSPSALLLCTRWKASHMEKEPLHTRCLKMLRIVRFSSMPSPKMK